MRFAIVIAFAWVAAISPGHAENVRLQNDVEFVESAVGEIGRRRLPEARAANAVGEAQVNAHAPRGLNDGPRGVDGLDEELTLAAIVHIPAAVLVGIAAVIELLSRIGERYLCRRRRCRVSLCVIQMVVGIGLLAGGGVAAEGLWVDVGLALIIIGECMRAWFEAIGVLRRVGRRRFRRSLRGGPSSSD